MALTREQIEDLYSRIPALTPPPHIFELANAEIGAERLYQAVHSLNASARRLDQERFGILGMQVAGTPFITVSGDSGESTVVHEAVHYMGVRNETATRVITRGLLARARFNLGVTRRQVRYAEMPVPPSERDSFLTSMHLSNPTGGDVQLVHLVYNPPQ